MAIDGDLIRSCDYTASIQTYFVVKTTEGAYRLMNSEVYKMLKHFTFLPYQINGTNYLQVQESEN